MDQGETEGHAKLEVLEVLELKSGDIYYLLPPQGDIHAVKTITRFAPSVSIHVLGNDTGCVWRNQYNLKQESVRSFRSGYSNAPCKEEKNHAQV